MATARSSEHPCRSVGKITAKLLLSFLVLSPALVSCDRALPVERIAVPDTIPTDFLGPGPVLGGGNAHSEGEHQFSLRHILHHGAYQYPELLRRIDVHPDTLVATEATKKLEPRPQFKLLSRSRGITRLSDRSKDTIEAHLLSHRYGMASSFAEDAWIREEIPQPNITDKGTVVTLSHIAADAYIQVEGTEKWLDVGSPYNLTDDFGWEGDGLRGHIFADENNSTVIIGLKGTSPAVFDGAETTTNDKVNDNLLFSCCCARISYWWATVCDCYSGTAYTCNQTCIGDSLKAENRYYRAALQLYYNVTQMYPESNIWVVGHSLGGAISSLIGQTYGLPVVTFEAPGEALASERLGLPMPPGETSRQTKDISVYHFGHTADPIFMGTCNGPTSVCSIGGYAMETRCHVGMECVYDVVGDHGWRMGMGYHGIQGVVKDIIESYDTVPECTVEPGCMDCFNWKFLTGNETLTTTTSSTATPVPTTSTTICETPGWWGCRDVTTTPSPTSTPTTTSPTTTATTTCAKYGWFGNCLDSTTTSHDGTAPTVTTTPAITSDIPQTSTAAATSPMPTSSETCKHYGWFGGCLDPEPFPTSASTLHSTQPAATSSCTHPGAIWGCKDAPSSTATATPTSTPAAGSWKCSERSLLGLGWCREWNWVGEEL
ncbi:Alpha/Beta hydrolase protein [Geopyxis carbonaria]|nr:Alpha/Beta hydrolase protein [Geopyxis carbonaria]